MPLDLIQYLINATDKIKIDITKLLPKKLP